MPPSTGSVLSVFRRSFYVQFGAHALCIGSVGLGNGPINLLVQMPDNGDWLELGVARLQKVWLSGTTVSVANRIQFHLENAAIWQPPLPPRFCFDDLATGLKQLSTSALQRSPGGLGAMLVGLSMLPDWPNVRNDPLLRTAQRPIREIAEWLPGALAHENEPPPRSILGLIGLGPGLTPSGDDFICGLMIALHYLGFADAAGKISAAVLPIAFRETNLVSSQFLRCAASGHASSALFDVLDAILTCRGLEEKLNVVHAIGHTSGWDSLAGAALVCAAILKSGRPPSSTEH